MLVSVEYIQVSKFPAQKFSSFNFRIINMITVSCRFAHNFKIIHLSQPIIHFRAPPQPVTVLCSGRNVEINVPYILYLDGQVTEAYELWALAEDGFCEVHRYASSV